MAEIASNIKTACTAAILDLFPDICPEYLDKTATHFHYDHGQAIEEILGCMEDGKSYPKRPRTKSLKRKRDASEDEDEVSQVRSTYDHADRPRERVPAYINLSKKVLAQDFPRATMKSIGRLLEQKNNHLLPTYLALEEITRSWREGNLQDDFVMKKGSTVPMREYLHNQLDETIRNSSHPDEKKALEELRAARQVSLAESTKLHSARSKELEEEENLKRAQAEGTATECGCCFGDFAKNRMVCCSKPDDEHYFCVDCARRNAETAIGLTTYDLTCMSMDGCSASFSNSQRSIFLDDKLMAALDRIECEAVLRMAGVEDLETCPFCPFAAEYPPVEEDKEFRCRNPECQIVSCRMCREETHIPKTCEEAARENGISARREIEEAMSAALIRKCNKCATPFIKDFGCNKMTCTRSGCRNVQCYVCSKSCDYSHFDDRSRGGRKGNCPLFEDGIEARHDEEVREAEKRTRQKILDDNPDLDEELLKIDFPQSDQKGNKEKLAHQPRPNLRADLGIPNMNDIVMGRGYRPVAPQNPPNLQAAQVQFQAPPFGPLVFGFPYGTRANPPPPMPPKPPGPWARPAPPDRPPKHAERMRPWQSHQMNVQMIRNQPLPMAANNGESQRSRPAIERVKHAPHRPHEHVKAREASNQYRFPPRDETSSRGLLQAQILATQNNLYQGPLPYSATLSRHGAISPILGLLDGRQARRYAKQQTQQDREKA